MKKRKMENEKIKNEKGQIGIGTKENVSLKPALVKVIGFEIIMQKDKMKVDIGEKVSVICKHPEKDETIEISSCAYKKGKEIKTSGLWFKVDSDGLIPKQSALANFLMFIKANNLDAMIGMNVPTELDEKNYLCFKAY